MDREKIQESRKNSVVGFLKKSNLSQEEAEQFYDLGLKINPPEDEIEAFYEEMDNSIPFEGGMGPTEAIVGFVEAIKR